MSRESKSIILFTPPMGCQPLTKTPEGEACVYELSRDIPWVNSAMSRRTTTQRRILVYYQTGQRAYLGACALKCSGFDDVVNLRGAFRDSYRINLGLRKLPNDPLRSGRCTYATAAWATCSSLSRPSRGNRRTDSDG